MEGSIFEPFLNIGFNFASLHGSGKFTNFMERLHILVNGFAKMAVPSFKNLPGRLPIPATWEMPMFFNSFGEISSVNRFN